MVNPHDTPSPHSRDWDDREREEEGSLSRPSGGSGSDYTRDPIDWSNENTSPDIPSPSSGKSVKCYVCEGQFDRNECWKVGKRKYICRACKFGSGKSGYYPKKRSFRKIAAIIITTILSVAVIGMFLFGDGSFDSLTQISIPLGDITEQISDTIQPCKVYNSIQITNVASQGTISLMSCSIENKDVLTVSGDLSKSAQINLTLLNPDMKKIQDVTFVKKEFSHIIGKELYSKDAGEWRINVIVSGKLQGVLKFIAN